MYNILWNSICFHFEQLACNQAHRFLTDHPLFHFFQHNGEYILNTENAKTGVMHMKFPDSIYIIPSLGATKNNSECILNAHKAETGVMLIEFN